MKYLLVSLLFVLGCSVEVMGANTAPLHSWSIYHWDSDSLNLGVVDKTTSSEWDGEVVASIDDWVVLGTPITAYAVERGRAPVTVGEGFSTQWLGLAQIWIEDGHITKGKVTLNTNLLFGGRYGSNAPRHVLCQEIGHIWGLDHNRDELDTCMNDCFNETTEADWLACLDAPLGITPNLHDTEQLNLMYDHEDSGGTSSGGGGPNCDDRPTHPRCRGGVWVTVHTTPVR